MSDNDFAMDSGVDLETTTEVRITDPVTGEPWADDQKKPVFVAVYSGQSERVMRAIHQIQGRFRIKINKNTGPQKGYPTYEQQRQYEAEIYGSVIADWHLTKKNGGPALDVKCTPQNAVTWCMANPLFAKQLSTGADDLAEFAKDVNFTKGS